MEIKTDTLKKKLLEENYFNLIDTICVHEDEINPLVLKNENTSQQNTCLVYTNKLPLNKRNWHHDYLGFSYESLHKEDKTKI